VFDSDNAIIPPRLDDLAVETSNPEDAPDDLLIEFESIRGDQREAPVKHAGRKISEQAQGVSIAPSPDDSRRPETRPDIDRNKDPDRLFLAAHYRANLIGLQLCNLQPSNPAIVESATFPSRLFQPAIHGVPGDPLDSGNRGFVHSFDTQRRNLVEGRSSMLEAIIDSTPAPTEGFAATRASESASAAPPGTIETIANNAFGCGLLSGALLVGAAETHHDKWTRSLAGVVTTKIDLKSYHRNELQLTRQQLFAEAPLRFQVSPIMA